MQFLRLLAAGVFVLVGMVAAAALLFSWLGDRANPALPTLTMIAVCVILIVAAHAIFGPRHKATDASRRDVVQALDAAGLLVSDHFTARRAFHVEEFEDEGSHYFIELTDGGVLFLSGQYLYAYEPDRSDAPERRFPCSDFTVRRHRDERYVVDIICRGEILEPELNAPPFSDEDYENGTVPEDGEILQTSYDEIKAARMRSGC